MAHSAGKEQSISNAINGGVIAWAAALLITGGLYLAQGWGIIAMVCGLLLLPMAVYGLARGRWIEPLAGSQLLLALALLTAAVVFQNLPSALVGLAILALACSTIMLVLVSRLQQQDVAQRDRTGTFARTGIDSPVLAEIAQLLRQLIDTSMLSESARTVLFRDRDLAAVQQAIQEAIARGDHEGATELCDALQRVFDKPELADQYRNASETASQEEFHERMHADLVQFEQLLAVHDWHGAKMHADEMRSQFGDALVSESMAERLDAAKRDHKHSLEQQFLHAAEGDDISAAMSLLKTLDQYLTRDEAQRLNQVAQKVVAQQRDRLGLEFRRAVNERRWEHAAEIGQQLIDEFPNTKMAQEVRAMIDMIRTRATEAAVSAGGRS